MIGMSVSPITDYLSIAAWPVPEDIDYMRELGVRLIISMTNRTPPPELAEPPFRLLHLPTNDNPFRPIPIPKLCQGVIEALPVIDAGQSVAVHCSRGRHRSVAMACSILIAKGHTAQEAMELAKARRREADPDIWYIRRRILRFAQAWPHECKR
jgi:hypothetical protein